MIPSIQQNAFYDWVQNGSGSCILEAVAGSGKTTTLCSSLGMMEGFKLFCAYNKKISEEIKDKVSVLNIDKLTVSTMHAVGFSIWRKFAKNVQVNNNKVRDIFRAASQKYPEYTPYEGVVISLVSYAKQAAFGVKKSLNSVSDWQNLICHYDLDCLDQEDLVIKLAKKTLEKSIELDHQEVDFDDMIFAPIYHKVKCFKYDWVLIDEAQDTNEARRVLALMCLKPNGRLVAVGDKHQAIYGFTGADSNSLQLIADEVNATYLPLTVTYRCPKNVVQYAQQWVNHIIAHESAPDGKVENLDVDNLLSNVNVGDSILCRFTAPLVENAYKLISNGIPAKVEGREIGSGLKKLASRWKVKTPNALINKLGDYKDREIKKLLEKDKESLVQSVEDRVQCLMIIIDRVIKNDPNTTNIVSSVCNEIDKIFDDNVSTKVVILSTIHKSKGREWENVFWLVTGFAKQAKLDWELEQEANLCYVAATRAKSSLYLVK